MEKLVLDADGKISIPPYMLASIGVSVGDSVWASISKNGSDSIVLQKSTQHESLVKCYSSWCEIFADIIGKPVAIVSNGYILSVSFRGQTRVLKDNKISHALSFSFNRLLGNSAVVASGKLIKFYFNKSRSATVSAFFRIKGYHGEDTFFVIVNEFGEDDSFVSGKVTRAEELRRYKVIKNIIEKLTFFKEDN